MLGDIHLEEDKVTISARWLYVGAWDIQLDSPDRRGEPSEGGSPLRRALVHDHSDGLTINYSSDYPGGVTLRGAVRISETLTVSGTTRFEGRVTIADDLVINSIRRPRIVGTERVRLHDYNIPGLDGRRADPIARVDYEPVTLIEVIRELQSQIRELGQRIAALEAR
jgi:hypothetical protein